jgi:hypothetical protein
MDSTPPAAAATLVKDTLEERGIVEVEVEVDVDNDSGLRGSSEVADNETIDVLRVRIELCELQRREDPGFRKKRCDLYSVCNDVVVLALL